MPALLGTVWDSRGWAGFGGMLWASRYSSGVCPVALGQGAKAGTHRESSTGFRRLTEK